jgi:hypothetical protein
MMHVLVAAGIAAIGPALLGLENCFERSAWAQTATLTWQTSLDDGATWNSGRVTLPETGGTARVRALVSWDREPEDIGLAGLVFDAFVTGVREAAGDRVREPVRVFDVVGQTLTVQPQSEGVVKIDDARDTLAPGAGPRGVNPSQRIPAADPRFNTTNPIEVFRFVLDIGGGAAGTGVRRVDAAFLPSQPQRAVTIFISPNGGQRAFPISSARIDAAEIEVIPGPGAGLILAMASTAALRRGRHRA